MVVLVCGSKSNFDDDVHAQCVMCHTDIFHRPYVSDVRVKVCPVCGKRMIQRDGSPENVSAHPLSIREVLAHQNK